jgi:hypothetical protein
MGKAFLILRGKPEGKRSMGRPLQRRDDNKINLMDWNHLARDRDQSRVRVNTAMSLPVP